MFFSGVCATGSPWYGGLPAVLAEASLFQLAACLNGACPTSFSPFFYSKADLLWLLGCFQLCGSGRGGLRLYVPECALRLFARLPILGFWLVVIGRIWVDWEIEFPFEGSAYRPLVRGNQEEHHGQFARARSIPAYSGEPHRAGP